jgi:hypothetical protein
MNWKAWKLGCAVSLVLSLFVALAGLVAGMEWRAFLAVFGAAAVTHFGSFLKDHPTDKIIFDADSLTQTRKDNDTTTSTPN